MRVYERTDDELAQRLIRCTRRRSKRLIQVLSIIFTGLAINLSGRFMKNKHLSASFFKKKNHLWSEMNADNQAVFGGRR